MLRSFPRSGQCPERSARSGMSTWLPGHRLVRPPASQSHWKFIWILLSLLSRFSPDSCLCSPTEPLLPPILPLEPEEGTQEKGYLLGHDGDLDKANEEEDKRGTRHIGTESVIHLLGVLRGHSRVRGWRHRP